MLRFLTILILIYNFCTPYVTIAQKSCSDTAKRISLFVSTDTSLFLIKVIPVGKNERLLLGYLHDNNSPLVNSPFITLTDSSHHVIWAKVLRNNVPIFFAPTDAIAAPNGEITVSFLYGNGGGALSFIARFEHSGNTLGRFVLNYGVQNKDALNHYLALSTDNNIVVLTKHAEGILNQKPYYWFSLVKLKPDGSVVWSKAYQAPDDFRENGIVVKNNVIYLQFNYWINNSGYTANTLRYAHHLMKFDGTTGALKKSKSLFYKEPTPRPADWGEGNYHYSVLSLYNSGDHTISSFSPDWSKQYSITRKNILTYDTSLNVISSMNITDTSGKFLFLSRAYIDTNSRVLISGATENQSKTGFSVLLNTTGTIETQSDINYLGEINRYATPINIGAIPVIQDYKKQLYSNGKVNNSFEVEIIESSLGNILNAACTSIEAKRIKNDTSSLLEGVLPFSFTKENFISTIPHMPIIIPLNIQYKIHCLEKIEIELKVTNNTTICKGDSIMLKSNSGFIRYNWPVTYNCQQLSDSSVKVFPERDTFYIVNAFTASGCTLSDTVYITVTQPKKINLGADTSFCKGDSLSLNAGAGFLNYRWNTGETNQLITITDTGSYAVKALNSNGCFSYDTLTVTKMFSNPSVFLKQDAVVCLNQSDTLDAGTGYQAYLWQDNSTRQYHKILQSGIYSVTVTDTNGCRGSDSVLIKEIDKAPHGFLISDTAICPYETIQLSPNSLGFSSYLWNNGNTNPSVSISSPGIYSLTVTNNNGCLGTESVSVNQKICRNKILFPNAFTPDNNGLNDLFKPFVEGSLSYYQLTIYNRWGQEVFNSTTAAKGWNGIYKNQQQNQGSFTWVCTFQFTGELKQTNKGTLYLIR